MTTFHGPVWLKIDDVKGSVTQPACAAGSIAARYLYWPQLEIDREGTVVGGGSAPWKTEHAKLLFHDFKDKRNLNLHLNDDRDGARLQNAYYSNQGVFSNRADLLIGLSAKLIVHAVLEEVLVTEFTAGAKSYEEGPYSKITLSVKRGRVGSTSSP